MSGSSSQSGTTARDGATAVAAGPGAPGPRIAPIAPGTRPELAAAEARILAERGRISALYQVLLNSEPLASGWEALLSAIRNRSTVPAALRELIILRVAVLNDAGYEFDAHVPHARAAGIDEATIAALRETPLADRFDADARLVLELADAMTRGLRVDDALFARLRARFDERACLETVATVAAYNMVSRLLVALQVGH